MNAPKIDMESTDKQLDTDGKKWVTALVKPDGEILAGRDEMGNFRAFADIEEIYDYAMATLNYLAEQVQP